MFGHYIIKCSCFNDFVICLFIFLGHEDQQKSGYGLFFEFLLIHANMQMQNMKIEYMYVCQKMMFSYINLMQKEEWTDMGQSWDFTYRYQTFC